MFEVGRMQDVRDRSSSLLLLSPTSHIICFECHVYCTYFAIHGAWTSVIQGQTGNSANLLHSPYHENSLSLRQQSVSRFWSEWQDKTATVNHFKQVSRNILNTMHYVIDRSKICNKPGCILNDYSH